MVVSASGSPQVVNWHVAVLRFHTAMIKFQYVYKQNNEFYNFKRNVDVGCVIAHSDRDPYITGPCGRHSGRRLEPVREAGSLCIAARP